MAQAARYQRLDATYCQQMSWQSVYWVEHLLACKNRCKQPSRCCCLIFQRVTAACLISRPSVAAANKEKKEAPQGCGCTVQ